MKLGKFLRTGDNWTRNHSSNVKRSLEGMSPAEQIVMKVKTYERVKYVQHRRVSAVAVPSC